MLFWIGVIVVSVCAVLGLKGRFSAKPFLTLCASVVGVVVNSFFLGVIWAYWDFLFWIDQMIMWVMIVLEFGFLWMLFRSFIELRYIHAKLEQIIFDQRQLANEAQNEFNKVLQHHRLQSSDDDE